MRQRVFVALTRLDSLLTIRWVVLYSITFLCIWTPFTVRYITSSGKLTTDYAAHLTGGRIVLDGGTQSLYDLHRQRAAQKQFIDLEGSELSVFISPPFVAFLYVPFAALPYEAGAALWTALSVMLLATSFRMLWPLIPALQRTGFWWVLLIAIGTMPTISLLIAGQDSALSLLLLVLGLRLLLARHDRSAGLVLALGVFKPQLFITMPVLLLLQQRWRALLAWVAGAATLSALSVAMVGLDGIESYRALLASGQYTHGIAQQQAAKMLSIVALVRSVGLASWVPVVISLACLVLAVAFGPIAATPTHEPHRLKLLYSVAILADAVISTHFFVYDGVVLFLPACVLLQEVPGPGVRLALALGALLPWMGLLGSISPMPWTIVPIALLLLIVWRSLTSEVPSTAPVVPATVSE